MPLIVLLSVFAVSLPATKFLRGRVDVPGAGRIAMSAMLMFTAIGHFLFTEGMAMMLPDFVPFKTETVYATGVIEIAAAIGLLIPGLRALTASMLILFFILILPANISAAVNHVDYQKGTYDGSGVMYLWFRIPLQILFIIWTYLFAYKPTFIKETKPEGQSDPG